MSRLVTVAHGTRSEAGNAVARALTEMAAERLAGMPAVTSYVELAEPLLAEVLATSAEDTVVVPLLLSTGYHVRQDLPAAAALAGGPVRLTPPLGPDPLLAAAQADRLREAGIPAGTPVVLLAAGSSDPHALADLERAAALLAAEADSPVEVATLSGLGRRPAEVLRPGAAVSPYLLAPGRFADRARTECGAAPTADVLGAHPLIANLIAARVRTAART